MLQEACTRASAAQAASHWAAGQGLVSLLRSLEDAFPNLLGGALDSEALHSLRDPPKHQ